jgi:hypothetical protein
MPGRILEAIHLLRPPLPAGRQWPRGASVAARDASRCRLSAVGEAARAARLAQPGGAALTPLRVFPRPHRHDHGRGRTAFSNPGHRKV